ncbi:MAG: hypothetical protein FWB72_07095, partial [Firmicutes bacterium]|nr:hypothetical protein [Bacillota bacterium]
MTRRLFMILLIAVLATAMTFVLVACNGDDDEYTYHTLTVNYVPTGASVNVTGLAGTTATRTVEVREGANFTFYIQPAANHRFTAVPTATEATVAGVNHWRTSQVSFTVTNVTEAVTVNVSAAVEAIPAEIALAIALNTKLVALPHGSPLSTANALAAEAAIDDAMTAWLEATPRVRALAAGAQATFNPFDASTSIVHTWVVDGVNPYLRLQAAFNTLNNARFTGTGYTRISGTTHVENLIWYGQHYGSGTGGSDFFNYGFFSCRGDDSVTPGFGRINLEVIVNSSNTIVAVIYNYAIGSSTTALWAGPWLIGVGLVAEQDLDGAPLTSPGNTVWHIIDQIVGQTVANVSGLNVTETPVNHTSSPLVYLGGVATGAVSIRTVTHATLTARNFISAVINAAADADPSFEANQTLLNELSIEIGRARGLLYPPGILPDAPERLALQAVIDAFLLLVPTTIPPHLPQPNPSPFTPTVLDAVANPAALLAAAPTLITDLRAASDAFYAVLPNNPEAARQLITAIGALPPAGTAIGGAQIARINSATNFINGLTASERATTFGFGAGTSGAPANAYFNTLLTAQNALARQMNGQATSFVAGSAGATVGGFGVAADIEILVYDGYIVAVLLL